MHARRLGCFRETQYLSTIERIRDGNVLTNFLGSFLANFFARHLQTVSVHTVYLKVGLPVSTFLFVENMIILIGFVTFSCISSIKKRETVSTN